MKTKTRNTIGKVLIWGGLAVIAVEALMIYPNSFLFGGDTIDLNSQASNLAKGLIGAIIALLIGGFMIGRKK